MNPRVILLGLDGLDFRLINPLIKKGYLPTFARLQESGAWGKLRSTLPPISPTAWNSMSTGLQPAKHGVFDFFQFNYGERRASLITRRRGGKAMWEILSEKNKRVIVINVPCTYPPDKVNGLMISGFMAPLAVEKAIYPKSFLSTLKNIAPDYGIEMEQTEIQDQNEQSYIEAVKENTRQKIDLLDYCLEKENFDFLFFVLEGTDRLQHKFWNNIMEGDPVLIEYYQLIDSVVNSIIDRLQPTDTLMIVSDHGFKPIDGLTFINELFVEHDLLSFRKTSYVLNLILKKYLIPILQKLRLYGSDSTLNLGVKAKIRKRLKGPLLVRMTDWENSKLLALTDTGSVYTTKYVERKGLDYLRDRIYDISHIDKVYLRHEAFGRGPYLQEAPGLVITDNNNDLRYEITKINRPSSDRCAIHDQYGILYALGREIKQSHEISKAGICDIAPTILHILETPIPKECDGIVLSDIFKGSVTQMENTANFY